MHFSSLISVALFAAFAVSEKCGSIKRAYARKVVSQFETDAIIPDLIEAPTLGTPKVKVNVAYGDKQVNLGTYFTVPETLTAPTLTFTGEKGYDPATTKYAFFMIDPDVPQDGGVVQVTFLHWMVYDAQPKCIKNQDRKTVAFYFPLTPGSTTQHRYTFLVYRQPPNWTPPTLDELTSQLRAAYDVNTFAQEQGLVLVGGNFLKEALTNGVVG